MRPADRTAGIAVAGLALIASLGPACKRDSETYLVVRADLVGAPLASPPHTLKVEVRDSAERMASHSFGGGDKPTMLPTTFSLQLSRLVQSPLRVEVLALDRAGSLLARGLRENVVFSAGGRHEVDVALTCLEGCLNEAGADAGASPGGGSADGPRGYDGRAPAPCGNGQVDEGELCNPGIPAGRWGACPAADCDDGLACTTDTPSGSGCRITCSYAPVTALRAGDGCCPAGATATTDGDCSATCRNGTVEAASAGQPGETCDLAVPAGEPGGCPTLDSCDDNDPCTDDGLISAGTCAALCARHAILDSGAADGCCAPGSNSGGDPDCPAVCGNHRKDPGETCDKGAAAGSPDACPTQCEDNNPCTRDLLTGTGCQTACQHLAITGPDPDGASDRCCPMGANRLSDPDCPALCGNGVVEPGEICDKLLVWPAPGACPTSCPAGMPPGLPACLSRRLEGRSEDCTARCSDQVAAAACSPTADGCCSERCSFPADPDCSPTCGNGGVDPGESCDTGIASGAPGACPASCADGSKCTSDLLVSRGTCNARCEYLPITTALANDGCCPPGANAASDSDCPATCGDGLVAAAGETCDKAIAPGKPGACPTSCPAPGAGGACQRSLLTGDAQACTSRCQSETVKTCTAKDGCCPAACNALTDSDCPAVCGNGVLEPAEACDRQISAGNPGACPALCDDNDACTSDSTLGRTSDCSRSCRHQEISACKSGDGCCPGGCSVLQDLDCRPLCGNGLVEAGEKCDPPSKCPSICPDDKDPCTQQRLVGDAITCSAVCVYTPILLCSGGMADKCCPSACLPVLDVDCGSPTADVSGF